MATAEEKVKVIREIRFPETTSDLEHFLGLTGYLRNYAPYYARVADPLTKLKIELIKDYPMKGNARKTAVSRAKVPDNAETRAAFEDVKKLFADGSFLFHQDPERLLYIDVDASKAFGFRAIVYHIKEDPPPSMAELELDLKNPTLER